MQLMIDTTDSPRLLRLASQFLEDAARISEAEIRNGGPLMSADPTLPILDAEDVRALEAMSADAGHVSEARPALDLRAAFAQPPAAAPPYVVPPPPVAPPSPEANAAAGGTTPIVPAGTAPELDKDGFPWDKRIHSETPKKNADGTWRRRRNLDNPTLVAVEAELRARVPVSAAPLIPPPPAPPAPAAAPVIPPPPAALPGFAGGVPAGALAFRALMTRVGNYTGEGGRLSNEIMKPIHAQFGAAGWQDYVIKCNGRIAELRAVIEGMLA